MSRMSLNTWLWRSGKFSITHSRKNQPLAEKVAQFEWQAQQNISRFLPPGGRRGIEDALDLHVVDRGNDWRDHHGGRDTGLREFAQRFEPSGRRRGTRLHHARQLRIEARHRE